MAVTGEWPTGMQRQLRNIVGDEGAQVLCIAFRGVRLDSRVLCRRQSDRAQPRSTCIDPPGLATGFTQPIQRVLLTAICTSHSLACLQTSEALDPRPRHRDCKSSRTGVNRTSNRRRPNGQWHLASPSFGKTAQGRLQRGIPGDLELCPVQCF